MLDKFLKKTRESLQETAKKSKDKETREAAQLALKILGKG